MKTLLATLTLATTAALSATAISAPAAAQTASITVTVENVRDGGTLEVVLYDSEAGWDGDAPVHLNSATPVDGEVTVTFGDLEPGDYAVRLYHDENGDNDFNMNFMGVPTEGYGFSNNPFPRFRGARWDESVFTVEAGDTHAETIELMGGGYW